MHESSRLIVNTYIAAVFILEIELCGIHELKGIEIVCSGGGGRGSVVVVMGCEYWNL